MTFIFYLFRSETRPPEDDEEEEEEILGSDDDEQEDPKDYVKGMDDIFELFTLSSYILRRPQKFEKNRTF
jgi:hypothetical protein